MKERTFFMIKPDGLKHTGDILSRIQVVGGEFIALKMMHLDNASIRSFCLPHEGRPYYNRLFQYLLMGPVLLGVVEGNNIIAHMEVLKGKIREDYAVSKTVDVIHSSDRVDAEREIKIFFDKSEMINLKEWTEVDNQMVAAIPDLNQAKKIGQGILNNKENAENFQRSVPSGSEDTDHISMQLSFVNVE